jgi:hypothetical protein
MGKGRTSKNYKKDILLNILEANLPQEPADLATCTELYQKASGEAFCDIPDHLHNHFVNKRQFTVSAHSEVHNIHMCICK